MQVVQIVARAGEVEGVSFVAGEAEAGAFGVGGLGFFAVGEVLALLGDGAGGEGEEARRAEVVRGVVGVGRGRATVRVAGVLARAEQGGAAVDVVDRRAEDLGGTGGDARVVAQHGAAEIAEGPVEPLLETGAGGLVLESQDPLVVGGIEEQGLPGVAGSVAADESVERVVGERDAGAAGEIAAAVGVGRAGADQMIRRGVGRRAEGDAVGEDGLDVAVEVVPGMTAGGRPCSACGYPVRGEAQRGFQRRGGPEPSASGQAGIRYGLRARGRIWPPLRRTGLSHELE